MRTKWCHLARTRRALFQRVEKRRHLDAKRLEDIFGLAVQLSEAIARKKFAKAAKAAVRTFVDFIDPRHVGAAVYAAGCANRLEAVRLLHEMRADLDNPATLQSVGPTRQRSYSYPYDQISILRDIICARP